MRQFCAASVGEVGGGEGERGEPRARRDENSRPHNLDIIPRYYTGVYFD